MGDLISSHFGSTVGGAATGAIGVSLDATCGAGAGAAGIAAEAGGAATNPEARAEPVLPTVGSIEGIVGMPLRTVSSKSGLLRVSSAMSV